MAKNMQPVLKRCRTLGVSPAAMGYSKTSTKNPGGQRRAKKSEYATQLTEKQKVKFVYGIQEKQFRNYYDKAARAEGKSVQILIIRIFPGKSTKTLKFFRRNFGFFRAGLSFVILPNFSHHGSIFLRHLTFPFF